MRLSRLHLLAFGPFTDRVLDFGAGAHRLVVVYGANEAGKSSALRAISALRFGIPLKSHDNFLHAYPDLKLGGEFVDAQGNAYSLLRRKGRGTTLLTTAFDGDQATDEAPASAAMEALLTKGLTSSAYDTMFSLDHQALRAGGEALLKGEGDIGAALFEASAGVRSIPGIVQALEQDARKFFMPGTRGKNARINEALRDHDAQHAQLKRAQIRPAQWADLFRKQQDARQALADLEQTHKDLHGNVLRIKELRAVAPLIYAYDHARTALETLQAVPLLPASAATDRAAAQSGLAAARRGMDLAAKDADQQEALLDALTLDESILNIAQAVRRLGSDASAIEEHQRDLADAEAQTQALTQRLTQLAHGMHDGLTAQALIEQAPGKTQKIHIEQVVRDQEQAQHALARHQENAFQTNDDEPSAALPAPVSQDARTALRVAQAEVTRDGHVLQQLASLPMEIKACQRALDAALIALNIDQLTQLQPVRPLMDAHIDEALKEKDANDAQQSTWLIELANAAKALAMSRQELTQLTQAGPVATRDDVSLARQHRDRGWNLIHAIYIDKETRPELGDYTQGLALPLVFDAALKRADELIDQIAADTERALRLQRLLHEIEHLESEHTALQQKLGTLGQQETQRQHAWNALLASSHLPRLTPAALRDWQRLLPVAQQAVEALRSKQDQQEHARGVENTLIASLQGAIKATGWMNVDRSAPLATLIAAAEQIEAQIRQHDALALQAEGRKIELERQRQQHRNREEQLKNALRQTADAMRPVMQTLFLPQDARPELVRSRLLEFDDLLQCQAQQHAAQEKRARASAALALIERSAQALQTVLGDSEPPVPRLYIDRLEQRLLDAEAKQKQRTLAQQAKEKALSDHALHTETAAAHQAVLTELCAMAQVQTSADLPQAETLSQRKRDVQQDLDRLGAQLAQASRRSIDELRQWLAQHDAVQRDADEQAWTLELDAMGARIQTARHHEEQHRRDLEAIDSSDAAASARDAMERAAATVRSSMPHWIRTRLAQALLAQALKRFRERAQGPMLASASAYFARMTGHEFTRLLDSDDGDNAVLLAERRNGAMLRINALSEGTRDQLYLALRLAALDLQRRSGVDLPAVFDDILMTSDDSRSKEILDALADFSAENQVILFTHHRHILDMARQRVPQALLHTVEL